ncbi:MAG: CDP-alcohol phosphatidyltransferase family protein [Myxococcota bacterium]
MIKSRVGADLDRVVLGLLPFVSRIRLHPDTLTSLGVAASLVSGAAFALNRPLTGGLLLLLAGFFDLIDGVVAREQGRCTRSGAFYDSSMDRLSDLLVYSGIIVGLAARGQTGGVALGCWALGSAVMTSYLRARAECELARFNLGLMERGERSAVLILGALIGWVQPALWVIAIGASLTSVQRLVAARRLLHELDVTGRDPTRPSAEPDRAEGEDAVERRRAS